jgi:hypothetical protein
MFIVAMLRTQIMQFQEQIIKARLPDLQIELKLEQKKMTVIKKNKISERKIPFILSGYNDLHNYASYE